MPSGTSLPKKPYILRTSLNKNCMLLRSGRMTINSQRNRSTNNNNNNNNNATNTSTNNNGSNEQNRTNLPFGVN